MNEILQQSHITALSDQASSVVQQFSEFTDCLDQLDAIRKPFLLGGGVQTSPANIARIRSTGVKVLSKLVLPQYCHKLYLDKSTAAIHRAHAKCFDTESLQVLFEHEQELWVLFWNCRDCLRHLMTWLKQDPNHCGAWHDQELLRRGQYNEMRASWKQIVMQERQRGRLKELGKHSQINDSQSQPKKFLQQSRRLVQALPSVAKEAEGV